jgi:hypothetical protein
VWVAIGAASVGVVVLVVDPAGSANFVVDSAGESRSHRLAGFSAKHAGAVYRRGLAGAGSHVVVELLGCGQADPLRQARPRIGEPAVHEYPVAWLGLGFGAGRRAGW